MPDLVEYVECLHSFASHVGWDLGATLSQQESDQICFSYIYYMCQYMGLSLVHQLHSNGSTFRDLFWSKRALM